MAHPKATTTKNKAKTYWATSCERVAVAVLESLWQLLQHATQKIQWKVLETLTNCTPIESHQKHIDLDVSGRCHVHMFLITCFLLRLFSGFQLYVLKWYHHQAWGASVFFFIAKSTWVISNHRWKKKQPPNSLSILLPPLLHLSLTKKKLKRRPAVARGEWFDQKMHQLQFKHLLKNKDQKPRILFGESLHIFKLDTFYSHMIIQTLCSYVPAGPQMCHSSKRQGDLRHFTSGSFIHKTTGDGGDFNEK